MSYDLAIWEGPVPDGDQAAAAEFERLYDEQANGDGSDPSAAITHFIDAITAKYPDLTDLSDDEVDDGVWSDGPLIGNATGGFIYLGIVWSRVEEVAPFVAATAGRLGLVCYDPQSSKCV